MPQYFVKGTDYSPGGTVNDTNLEALIESATPQNFERSVFAADSAIITLQTAAPNSPKSGELWFDTNNGVLKVWVSPNWIVVGPGAEQILSCSTTCSIGSPLVSDTATNGSVKTTSDSANQNVVGVAKEAISTTPSDCRIQTSGIVEVFCSTAEVARGDWLVTSTTTGQAESASAKTVGAFAQALDFKASGATGLVTARLVDVGVQTMVASQEGSGGFGTSGVSLSFSDGSGTMSQDTWYPFPGTTGADVSAPSTEFGLSLTTTRNNQLVFVYISEFLCTFASGVNQLSDVPLLEFRLNVDGSYPAVWTYNDNIENGTTGSDSAGGGAGAIVYEKAGGETVVVIDSLLIPWVISTKSASPGDKTVRLEWRARDGLGWNASQEAFSGSGKMRVFTEVPG